jgi:hypothetical protein
MRSFRVAITILTFALPVFAQGGRPGTGNPDIQLVSWKYLDKTAELPKGPFIVYWLPATMKDIELSPLFTSKPLLEDATRCIEFEIVSPDDSRLGVKPPAAMIVSDGKTVRQIASANPKEVERMVAAGIDSAEEAVLTELQRARREKSVDLYKKIWGDRCLYPLIGLEAQRGLKELGVIVTEPPSTLMPDPNLKVDKPTTKKPPG